MNARTMWKKLREAAGFTLVELIVVIAILGILAGVAVPVSTGYIKKTNMAADQTLISDIENALMLSFYDGTLTEGEAGFLLLYPEKWDDNEVVYEAVDDVDTAMTKSFGANWVQTMVLKHDGWGAKSMMLSYDDAAAVVNSNFVQEYTPAELMAQVQAMTDAVNGLQLEIGDTQIRLYDMFGYGESSNSIDDVIEEYGIEKSWDEMSSTEKSNLLVLATASGISNNTGSGAANLLPKYALFVAYAAVDPTFNVAYQTFQTSIANVDPNSADSEYEQIKAAYHTLEDAAATSGFEAWKVEHGAAHEDAFSAVMAGVGNAMKDSGDEIIADLGNANMFTTGVGSKLYNDYLNTAYVTASGSDNAEALNDIYNELQDGGLAGCVLIQYAVVNGAFVLENSLPVK